MDICFNDHALLCVNNNAQLCFNDHAPFTRWAVEQNHLQEQFVVVDIGVQGGESPRWDLLGDRLVIHGFDAIKEVIESLKALNLGKAHRHYHWIAAGDEDGERTFYFNQSDPYSSSLFEQGENRFGTAQSVTANSRQVPIRRLDTLLEQGLLPKADFLKVDVEGFEKHVLMGAEKLLGSDLLGIETETNFSTSPEYPKSHFGTIQELVLAHNFLVFDINFNRIPRATFQQALQRTGRKPVTDQRSVGKPATLNVLFCRDLIGEVDSSQNFQTKRSHPTIDQIIKMMIIYELHGLNDIAVDTAERYRDDLSQRLDVDLAIRLLTDPYCRKREFSFRARQWAVRQAKRIAKILKPSVN